jgi:hypothetical protein
LLCFIGFNCSSDGRKGGIGSSGSTDSSSCDGRRGSRGSRGSCGSCGSRSSITIERRKSLANILFDFILFCRTISERFCKTFLCKIYSFGKTS